MSQFPSQRGVRRAGEPYPFDGAVYDKSCNESTLTRYRYRDVIEDGPLVTVSASSTVLPSPFANLAIGRVWRPWD
jgi:hypothetical protein